MSNTSWAACLILTPQSANALPYPPVVDPAHTVCDQAVKSGGRAIPYRYDIALQPGRIDREETATPAPRVRRQLGMVPIATRHHAAQFALFIAALHADQFLPLTAHLHSLALPCNVA